MTDEKAKEILDFLARKTRYSSFVFIIDIGSYLPCLIDRRHLRHILYITKELKDPKIFGHKHMLPTLSYAAVLSSLLESSDDGYDIETDIVGEIFLPAHSSLEQILVEMDLNKSLEDSL